MKYRTNLMLILSEALYDDAGLVCCWQCGKTLLPQDIKGTKTNPELQCSVCGFIIVLDSKANRLVNLIGTLAFLTVVAIFSLIGVVILFQ